VAANREQVTRTHLALSRRIRRAELLQLVVDAVWFEKSKIEIKLFGVTLEEASHWVLFE